MAKMTTLEVDKRVADQIRKIAKAKGMKLKEMLKQILQEHINRVTLDKSSD